MKARRDILDEWGMRVLGYAQQLGVLLTSAEAARIAFDLRTSDGRIPVERVEAVRHELVRLGKLKAAA